MALDQSALLEVLDALRNADAGDRIKQAAETIYQALIDAELTAVIGAGPHERTDVADQPAQRITVAHDLHDGRGFGAADSRSCGPVRSSRRCWSDAAGSTSACSRW